MIDAKELRKGNKVLFEGMLLTIKEIKEHEATFEETPAAVEYPDIDAIPLTPELLEACGFEQDRNGWHMPETQFSLTDQFYPCWLDRMLWPQDLQEFKHLSLRYLHQLQNLFFALTASELSVNLEKVKA